MSTPANTENPTAIVILHGVYTAAVFALALAALISAVFAKTVTVWTGDLMIGLGLLFASYMLWKYRAQK